MNNTFFTLRSRNHLRLLCFVIIVFVSACDSDNMKDYRRELIPLSETEVIITNGNLSVTMKKTGVLESVRYVADPLEPNVGISIASSLGLWVAGMQNGTVRSNIMALVANAIDNFQLQQPDLENHGLYFVTKDGFEDEFENWTSIISAPTYPDGRPKMMGDVMAWGTFAPFSKSSNLEYSFSDLLVGVTAYMFNDVELKSTLFVRYEIFNQSQDIIENLHLGFGGDVDLGLFEPTAIVCGRVNASSNLTGYDRERNVSYTYIKPDLIDGELPGTCYGALTGYSIMGFNSGNGTQASALAHRVLTKEAMEPFGAFSTTGILVPYHVLHALQGLSPEGAPMIDPSTGEVTSFAYTGNPLTETGWVDTRKDVRSLLSISPITLAPGEKVITTVAIFTAVSPSFEQGYADLSTLFDRIMSQRNKWDN